MFYPRTLRTLRLPLELVDHARDTVAEGDYVEVEDVTQTATRKPEIRKELRAVYGSYGLYRLQFKDQFVGYEDIDAVADLGEFVAGVDEKNRDVDFDGKLACASSKAKQTL